MKSRHERPAILVSPGPVHVSPETWEDLPPLHHRSDDFRHIVKDTERMLQELAGTASSRVYLITSSGTGAMEAAVANVTASGKRVLVVSGGKFGRRWAEICDAYECRTVIMDYPNGKAIDVDSVRQRIRQERPECVALTHVESSTGLLFPLKELAASLGAEAPLLMVDAISSLGAEEINMDAWGIDVIVGASQKALATPAGVSFVVAGKRASELMGARRAGAYYLDLKRYEVGRERGDLPFTPAIRTIQMMHRSLAKLREIGFARATMRHRQASSAFLSAAKHLSLDSYSENPSSAVQVLVLPEQRRFETVLARLSREGFIAAGGQDELKSRVLRTGFLGIFDARTLERLVSALGKSLREDGCAVDAKSAEKCIREYDADFSLFL